jgi:HPt (histidine-containing phosphotransfer) domain-containing protein
MTLPEGDQPMPVDPETLQMLAELQEPGEPDLLRELITLFLRDTPERMDAARAALASLDFETAGRAAHSVKGSAANLGANQLQALAGTAEAAARDQDATALTAALAALDEEFARVRAQLERVRATRPH